MNGTGNDHRVPERDRVSSLQANRVQDVLHSGTVYLPHGQVGNDLRRHSGRQRLGNLLRSVDIEFLQDLDTQAALTRLPQRTNQIAGSGVLVSCRAVVGVDEDVGVDELQIAKPAFDTFM